MTSLLKSKGMGKLPKSYRRYLNERGISDEVIKRRKIGQLKVGKKEWIAIPIPDKNGEVQAVVLRCPPDAPDTQKRYEMVKGSAAMLYPLDAVHAKGDLLLCEGVLDALAAESVGIHAASGTSGAATFKQEWIEHIPEEKKVIVCYDTDDAGRKGRDKVLKLLGSERPDLQLSVIDLPDMGEGKKDVTDFLLRESKEPRKELLALAKAYSERQTPSSFLEELKQETSKSFLPFQDFTDGVGYYTLTVRKKGKPLLFTVTSKREGFLCTEEELQRRGLNAERLPLVDEKESRWAQADLVRFLEGAETPTLKVLYDRIVALLQRYVEFPDIRLYSCVALWILGTYFYRHFSSYPYIHVSGQPECGKSKVLQVIAALSFNGVMLSSATAAVVVRLIHNNGATCCLDEEDRMENKADEFSQTLQAILRSGYKKGALVPRCEKSGQKWEVSYFDGYSPKVIAGTKPLEGALASRCIQLVMLRSRNSQISNQEVNPDSKEWAELRSQLYAAALTSFPQIVDAHKGKEVEGIIGRGAEIIRPLLILADVIDPRGTLSTEVLDFGKQLRHRRREQEAEETEASKVITAIYELLEEQPDGHLHADDIFFELQSDDDLAWLNEPWGRTRKGKWLNRTLKMLGLWDGPSKLMPIRGVRKKGYIISVELLREAAERFGVTLDPAIDGSDGSPSENAAS